MVLFEGFDLPVLSLSPGHKTGAVIRQKAGTIRRLSG